MSTLKQSSLSGGELAPSLHARTDLIKFQTGARTMRNTLVLKSGGTVNRPGTLLVAECAPYCRLIDFIFNNEQAYVLEFSALKIRIIKDGSYIYEAAKTITAASKAAQGEVTTSAAHGFSSGNKVLISGVTGMKELNGRHFLVEVVSSTKFKIKTLDGASYINTSAFGTYVSGGTVKRVYTVTSPYAEADLDGINYVQNADVMTLVHPSYAPRELSRLADDSWTIASMSIKNDNLIPDFVTATASAGGSIFGYIVTAVDPDTREESLGGYSGPAVNIASVAIGAAVNGRKPITITTSAAHLFINGGTVRITGTGTPEINDREFRITGVSGPSSTTFQLVGEDGTGYAASGAGGTARPLDAIASGAPPSASTPIFVSWRPALKNGKTITEYNVYKVDGTGAGFGFIGVAFGSSFVDIGFTPDQTIARPVFRKLFQSTGDYPSTVAYLQQRQAFAGSNNAPETVDLSRIGAYRCFSISQPMADDDPVTFSTVGRRVNKIKHLLDVGSSLMFTSDGEWVIQGGASGVITPTEINLKQVSFNGCSNLRPIGINGTALYVQARGSIVRDISYDFQADGYNGNDLTVFATHLFEGYTLTSWAFQQVPNSILVAARSDGKLVALTYLREHQIWAWHWHDFTDGFVESVCSVPEGNEDAVYLSIRTTDHNGATIRHIVRMASRVILDVVDAVFMDSAVTYDGRNTNTAHKMTLGAGGADDTITLTSSTAHFASTDVGKTVILTGSDGEVIRFQITAYTSSTQVSGSPNRNVPASIANQAISTWARAISTVQNLWHLEGRDIAVFGDGYVVASPNNQAYETVTVQNGEAVLDRPFAVVHAGIPYLSDLETLDIDTLRGETLSDKMKIVNKVNLHLEKTRGVWVGPKPPTDDSEDPLEGLEELKIRDSEGYDETVALFTGVESVVIRSEWNSNGRVFIRQVDPVPISVLAVSPSLTVGKGAK